MERVHPKPPNPSHLPYCLIQYYAHFRQRYKTIRKLAGELCKHGIEGDGQLQFMTDAGIDCLACWPDYHVTKLVRVLCLTSLPSVTQQLRQNDPMHRSSPQDTVGKRLLPALRMLRVLRHLYPGKPFHRSPDLPLQAILDRMMSNPSHLESTVMGVLDVITRCLHITRSKDVCNGYT